MRKVESKLINSGDNLSKEEILLSKMSKKIVDMLIQETRGVIESLEEKDFEIMAMGDFAFIPSLLSSISISFLEKNVGFILTCIDKEKHKYFLKDISEKIHLILTSLGTDKMDS